MKKNLMLSGLFVLIMALQGTAQKILKGQVKNEKGQAIEAATIHVRGTKTTVAADASGIFFITLSEKLPADITYHRCWLSNAQSAH
jgi:hypothetical protein